MPSMLRKNRRKRVSCYQPLWDLVLSQWPDEPDSGDDGTTP